MAEPRLCPACGQDSLVTVSPADKVALCWGADTVTRFPMTAYRCNCGQVFLFPAIPVTVERLTNAMFV